MMAASPLPKRAALGGQPVLDAKTAALQAAALGGIPELTEGSMGERVKGVGGKPEKGGEAGRAAEPRHGGYGLLIASGAHDGIIPPGQRIGGKEYRETAVIVS